MTQTIKIFARKSSEPQHKFDIVPSIWTLWANLLIYILGVSHSVSTDELNLNWCEHVVVLVAALMVDRNALIQISEHPRKIMTLLLRYNL